MNALTHCRLGNHRHSYAGAPGKYKSAEWAFTLLTMLRIKTNPGTKKEGQDR